MSDLIKKSEDADLEVMPSFDFVLEKEAEQQTQVAEHRAWLKSIRHERPLPKHHYKVAVYIRYFNQTKHVDYLSYHVLDRTLRLCAGTWEGDMNSLCANFLNGVARLVNTYGDKLKEELFKERVGATSVKQLTRNAKERRPGSMGFAEAMLVAYNRKCKYPLVWNKLYEKNSGTTDGLDADIPGEEEDEQERMEEQLEV